MVSSSARKSFKLQFSSSITDATSSFEVSDKPDGLILNMFNFLKGTFVSRIPQCVCILKDRSTLYIDEGLQLILPSWVHCRLIQPSILLSLLTLDVICLSTFRLDCMITPRYLASLTVLRVVSPSEYRWEVSSVSPNIITSHIFHLSDQL